MKLFGDGITFDSGALSVGTVFDTEYEDGCIVTAAPDMARAYTPRGCTVSVVNFLALDSERVECEFPSSMVQWIHRTS